MPEGTNKNTLRRRGRRPRRPAMQAVVCGQCVGEGFIPPQTVKKLHSFPIACVGATIGRPSTYRSNAFSGIVSCKANGRGRAMLAPTRVFRQPGEGFIPPGDRALPQTSREARMPPLQTIRKRHFSERFVGAAYMRPAEFPPPQTSRVACMPPLRANPPTPTHPGSRWQPRGRGRACPARGVKGSCPLKGGRADLRAGRARPLPRCGPKTPPSHKFCKKFKISRAKWRKTP